MGRERDVLLSMERKGGGNAYLLQDLKSPASPLELQSTHPGREGGREE